MCAAGPARGQAYILVEKFTACRRVVPPIITIMIVHRASSSHNNNKKKLHDKLSTLIIIELKKSIQRNWHNWINLLILIFPFTFYIIRREPFINVKSDRLFYLITDKY